MLQHIYDTGMVRSPETGSISVVQQDFAYRGNSL